MTAVSTTDMTILLRKQLADRSQCDETQIDTVSQWMNALEVIDTNETSALVGMHWLCVMGHSHASTEAWTKFGLSRIKLLVNANHLTEALTLWCHYLASTGSFLLTSSYMDVFLHLWQAMVNLGSTEHRVASLDAWIQLIDACEQGQCLTLHVVSVLMKPIKECMERTEDSAVLRQCARVWHHLIMVSIQIVSKDMLFQMVQDGFSQAIENGLEFAIKVLSLLVYRLETHRMHTAWTLRQIFKVSQLIAPSKQQQRIWACTLRRITSEWGKSVQRVKMDDDMYDEIGMDIVQQFIGLTSFTKKQLDVETLTWQLHILSTVAITFLTVENDHLVVPSSFPNEGYNLTLPSLSPGHVKIYCNALAESKLCSYRWFVFSSCISSMLFVATHTASIDSDWIVQSHHIIRNILHVVFSWPSTTISHAMAQWMILLKHCIISMSRSPVWSSLVTIWWQIGSQEWMKAHENATHVTLEVQALHWLMMPWHGKWEVKETASTWGDVWRWVCQHITVDGGQNAHRTIVSHLAQHLLSKKSLLHVVRQSIGDGRHVATGTLPNSEECFNVVVPPSENHHELQNVVELTIAALEHVLSSEFNKTIGQLMNALMVGMISIEPSTALVDSFFQLLLTVSDSYNDESWASWMTACGESLGIMFANEPFVHLGIESKPCMAFLNTITQKANCPPAGLHLLQSMLTADDCPSLLNMGVQWWQTSLSVHAAQTSKTLRFILKVLSDSTEITLPIRVSASSTKRFTMLREILMERWNPSRDDSSASSEEEEEEGEEEAKVQPTKPSGQSFQGITRPEPPTIVSKKKRPAPVYHSLYGDDSQSQDYVAISEESQSQQPLTAHQLAVRKRQHRQRGNVIGVYGELDAIDASTSDVFVSEVTQDENWTMNDAKTPITTVDEALAKVLPQEEVRSVLSK